jgi:hypothetical protein
MNHRHIATFVCTTDTTRSKTFPFADGADIPKRITDKSGDEFALVLVTYDVDVDELDAQAARVRAWGERHFGGKAA